MGVRFTAWDSSSFFHSPPPLIPRSPLFVFLCHALSSLSSCFISPLSLSQLLFFPSPPHPPSSIHLPHASSHTLPSFLIFHLPSSSIFPLCHHAILPLSSISHLPSSSSHPSSSFFHLPSSFLLFITPFPPFCSSSISLLFVTPSSLLSSPSSYIITFSSSSVLSSPSPVFPAPCTLSPPVVSPLVLSSSTLTRPHILFRPFCSFHSFLVPRFPSSLLSLFSFDIRLSLHPLCSCILFLPLFLSPPSSFFLACQRTSCIIFMFV